MHSISEHQVVVSLIILALVIALGRGAGDVARRLGQPEVLGQLLAGFLLGLSGFGALTPGVYQFLFADPDVGTALSLFSWVGAILLLLMAGIEMDLSILRQEAKPGAFAAAFAIIPSGAWSPCPPGRLRGRRRPYPITPCRFQAQRELGRPLDGSFCAHLLRARRHADQHFRAPQLFGHRDRPPPPPCCEYHQD